MAGASIGFCLLLRYCLSRENRKMEAVEEEDVEGSQKRIRYIL